MSLLDINIFFRERVIRVFMMMMIRIGLDDYEGKNRLGRRGRWRRR